MTKPRARILDSRACRREDPRQLALFANTTHRSEGDSKPATFIGPLRPNPYRLHVLRMREMRAQEAARRAEVPA